jgi:hypothetical protein
VTPNEAGRELARAAGVIRSTGRRSALWKAGAATLPALGIVAGVRWLPAQQWTIPGSALPTVALLLVLASIGAAGLLAGATLRSFQLRRRVREVEAARGFADGEVVAAFELEAGCGSASLAALHKSRVAGVLRDRPASQILPRSHARLRSVRRVVLPGVGALIAVLAVGIVDDPGAASKSLAILTRPWSVTFPPPPPPLRLDPPGGEVLRGDPFEVEVSAESRARVVLVQGRPGDLLRRDTLTVVNGVAVGRIDAVDVEVRIWAEDGRSATDTFVVRPVDPLTVTELRVDLTYPPYLDRAPESLSGPLTELDVPAGTRLAFTVRTNHPVAAVGVTRDRGAMVDTLWLNPTGDVATGTMIARDSAYLSWLQVPASEVPAVQAPPGIDLSARPDAPPSVGITYPGEDRLFGATLSLPLVIEARDDNGLAAVGLTWWRESSGGRRGQPQYESLATGSDVRRLVLRPELDMRDAGVLPGDEIVYFASASDRNPASGASVSDTFRARMPELEDLRDSIDQRTEDLVEDTRLLRERTGDLAAASRDAERRARAQMPGGLTQEAAEQTDFGATEEARDLLAEARAVEDDLTRAQETLEDIREDVAASPVVDPDLQRRLEELEDVFREIMDSGLREKIEALESSLRGLDPERLREATEGLSRQSSELEDRLDRVLGLMERVALEQSLEGARQRAESLAREQEAAVEGKAGDEAWRRGQEEMARAAQDLAARIDDLAERLDRQQAPDAADLGRRAAEDARAAAASMDSGARDAGGEHGVSRDDASAQAQDASERLRGAERNLAAASEQLAADWRADAMQVVGRATTEALELAREQERIVESIRSGTPPEELADNQSGLREGLDNLSQTLADAGRKTALMDRRSGPAASRAGQEMDALAQSLSSGSARRSEAMRQGQSVMEALSDLAGSLLSSARAMSEASSATGMEEALQRLAELGRRQGGLNSESGDLLMLMRAGQGAGDQLGALARRQSEVSEELRQLSEEPAMNELGRRPEALADESAGIARRLAEGQLDAETLARQERLFRSLLDAGRSLERDEEDVDRRESTAARPRIVLVPVDADTLESGPRHPYPDAESMQDLTPAQRRLVYEYFDRLNGDTGGVRP